MRSKFYAILSFLPLFCTAAFRYGVGTDYFYTYVPGFLLINGGGDYDYYEIGFYWLNRIIANYTDNYQVLFFVTSLIIYGFIYFMITKYSVLPSYSVFLFVCSSMYFNSLNNIRQFSAMALCFFALKYILFDSKRNIIKYFIFIFIATTIHTSAIVYLILPFLLKLEIKYISQIILLCLSIVFKFIMGNKISLLIEIFANKYSRYLSSNNNSIYFSFLVFNLIIYLFMIFLESYYIKGKDKLCIRYLNIELLAVLLFIYSDVIPLADRVSRYFMLPLILSVPYFISKITNIKAKRLLKYGISIFFILWISFYLYRGDDAILPYQSIFSTDYIWYKYNFGN